MSLASVRVPAEKRDAINEALAVLVPAAEIWADAEDGSIRYMGNSPYDLNREYWDSWWWEETDNYVPKLSPVDMVLVYEIVGNGVS